MMPSGRARPAAPRCPSSRRQAPARSAPWERGLPLALLALLGAACAEPPGGDPEADAQAVRALIHEVEEANNAGDVERWVALFAADAIYMPPGPPEVTDRDSLVGDAVSALAALRDQPEVAPAKAGYLGASQGGWVGPIAAGRSDPAFMIVSGGGPVTPATQERYRRLLLVEQSGVNAAERADAEAALDLWFAYLRTPDALAAEVRAHWAEVDVADRSWRRDIGVPSQDPTVGEWPEVRRRFARELHFDPMPHCQALDVPTLGLIGLEDQNVPVGVTLQAYNELPIEADLTVAVFPRADHGYFVELGPGRRNQVPEVFTTMAGWTLAVTGRP